MTWQLHIQHCPRDLAERLNVALEDTAAVSITLMDQFDTPILEPELGTEPLWADVLIEALYPQQEDAELAVRLLALDQLGLTYAIAPLVEKDWVRLCQNDFQPQQFGERLWVCPSWSTPPDPTAVNLRLDPGLAFGTGTHPTTALCLTWLAKASLDQKQVIDYGCGSGILALAALKLGAQHVYAVDIDGQALTAIHSNASLNGINAPQLTIDYPETLHAPVDLIIANILLTPLLTLKARFCELLRHQGTLVVSGVLAEQVNTLVEAYQDVLTHQRTFTQDIWALVEFSVQ